MSVAETVLLVEDDARVRKLLHRVLTRAGFRVLSCGTGEEAAGVFGAARVKMLVSDFELGSGMNGIQLAQLLRNCDARVRVLVMSSGFSDAGCLASENRLAFIAKPISPRGLIERVRGILDDTASTCD